MECLSLTFPLRCFYISFSFEQEVNFPTTPPQDTRFGQHCYSAAHKFFGMKLSQMLADIQAMWLH